MQCGSCGAGFSKINAYHFGCAGGRLKGPTTCLVLRTVRKDVLDAAVMKVLREQMMDPEVYGIMPPNGPATGESLCRPDC